MKEQPIYTETYLTPSQHRLGTIDPNIAKPYTHNVVDDLPLHEKTVSVIASRQPKELVAILANAEITLSAYNNLTI